MFIKLNSIKKMKNEKQELFPLLVQLPKVITINIFFGFCL